MTPSDIRSTLATLGWSSNHLARLLGKARTTPWNWIAGRSAVPADIAAWLQRRVEAHQRMMRDDPPPGAAP